MTMSKNIRVTCDMKIHNTVFHLVLMLSSVHVIHLYKFVVLLSVFGKCFCENSNISAPNDDFVPRVVNGWPGALGDVPYQVAFKNRRSRHPPRYGVLCGGTIVAPMKIISAAHCFEKKMSECLKLFMKVGHVKQKELRHTYAVAGTLSNAGVKPATDGTEQGQWRALKEVFYPRRYKFPRDDIALVYTTTPFVYNNHVNAIPYASRFIDYRGKCLVSGYGRISTTAALKSDKLLLAHLDLLSRKRCSKLMRIGSRSLICTSSVVTDIGKGDSGGPLVCKNTTDPKEKDKGILVGVVSGHSVGRCSFFTRVSSFYGYIQRDKSCNNHSNSLMIVLILSIKYSFLPF